MRPAQRRLSAKEKVHAVAKAGSMASTATLNALPDATGPPKSATLANDLLVGAGAIAEFMFGSATERRRVYWFIERGELPVFKLGATICARSTIMREVAQREAREAELNAT